MMHTCFNVGKHAWGLFGDVCMAASSMHKIYNVYIHLLTGAGSTHQADNALFRLEEV